MKKTHYYRFGIDISNALVCSHSLPNGPKWCQVKDYYAHFANLGYIGS